MMTLMHFAPELDAVLPSDLPHREAVIGKTARHLELIAAANEQFNLTRIQGEREAAVKHVLDSVLPWKLFAESKHVLDAGTGAGFPGIPLALVFPEVEFTLADSTGKKAQFVESAAAELGLRNVKVIGVRVEEWLRKANPDTITARAITPLEKACGLFGPAVRRGSRAFLYKGPDAFAEILDAAGEARRYKVRLRILEKYELPDDAGERTIVEMRA